jgi:serine/threonine-protein kinase
VYVLGVVMYEMVLGRRPFLSKVPETVAAQHVWMRPPAPSQLSPMISPALEAILLRCLEKEPENRFQNGSELAHAILVQLEDAAVDEYPLSSQIEEKGAPGYDI